MQRLPALLILAAMLLMPALILAQGLLPDGAKDIFGALVGWPRTTVEYVFLAAAWAGVAAHWANKRRLGEITGNFAAYLMAERRDFAFSTVTALIIYAAIMGLIMAGLVATVPWPGAMFGGLAVGWVIDSILTPKT